MQTPHVTYPEFEKFTHQSSTVDQILSVLGTLEDTISNIRNRCLLNDSTNHIQKGLDLLPIVFRSRLDQFSLVENPDILQLLILSCFHQYYFKNYPIYRRLQSISKYKLVLSNYLSSLFLFH